MRTQRPRRLGRKTIIALVVYFLVLMTSQVIEKTTPRAAFIPSLPDGVERLDTTIRARNDDGPVSDANRRHNLSAIVWRTNADDPKTTVILLHGSPGLATDFLNLGPRIAETGRDVYSLDLPGFGFSGAWIPRYSARSYAHAIVAWMDANGIERAHTLGWSNSGNVVIHLADIDAARDGPERIASITMLGATGTQDTEGSGSRAFELAKYAVGYAALVVGPEFLPHFGALFPTEWRHAFMRNFIDTDQRLIDSIAPDVRTPTLILQGRHDFLVADWAAERHHEILPASCLVMLDSDHFAPFMQPGLIVEHFEPFIARHETSGIKPEIGTLDLAPRPKRGPYDTMLAAVRGLHWIAPFALLTLAARTRPAMATAVATVLVAEMSVDFGVATAALWLGSGLRPQDSWDRRGPIPWLCFIVGITLRLALAWIVCRVLFEVGTPLTTRFGFNGVIEAVAFVLVATPALHGLTFANRIFTREGRQMIAADFARLIHHEWWPTWLLYAPITPALVVLAIKHRGLLIWTAANPCIENGGGIVNERKSAILRCLEQGSPNDDRILHHALIQPGPLEVRIREAEHLIDSEPSLNGYPIIIKPDAGERGAAVTLVRTRDGLRRALDRIPGVAMLQQYHPGPIEAGVFWVREASSVSDPSAAPQGRVFSITRKTFPKVTGNGTDTLRALIMRHPRYRIVRRVFFQRHADDLDRVIAVGETVQLASAGNHAQGCRFSDGADLITPELEHAVTQLASNARDEHGNPFDFGRFDLRAESEEALKAGRFAVVELNGSTSESTNLYDPDRSPRFAWRLLIDQWSRLFALGAARKNAGYSPLSIRRLIRVLVTPRTRLSVSD